MGLGVGIRVGWLQLPRRKGQGQRGRPASVSPGALSSARAPAPGSGAAAAPRRSVPGGGLRGAWAGWGPRACPSVGPLAQGGSWRRRRGRGLENPNCGARELSQARPQRAPLSSGDGRTDSRDRQSTEGRCGAARERRARGRGPRGPRSSRSRGEADTHSGWRDLGFRTNRRQREVRRTVGGAGVTLTTAIGGRRHLGRGAKQTDTGGVTAAARGAWSRKRPSTRPSRGRDPRTADFLTPARGFGTGLEDLVSITSVAEAPIGLAFWACRASW